MEPEDKVANPPKENLVRGLVPGLEIRDGAEADDMPTLAGHFAVFNEWTEINSLWEGNFLERVAPGAFTKTFAENRAAMRVLFQHGRDPQVGDKPLGIPTALEQDDVGARYEVPLFDTSYNRDLVPALKAGAYGASFRFQVMREEFDKEPEPSDHNPSALPERTIKEARVMEFGPVTFPAYEGATAGVRCVSLTDEYIARSFLGDPDKLRAILEHLSTGTVPEPAPSDSTPAVEPPADTERRDVESTIKRYGARADWLAALSNSRRKHGV